MDEQKKRHEKKRIKYFRIYMEKNQAPDEYRQKIACRKWSGYENEKYHFQKRSFSEISEERFAGEESINDDIWKIQIGEKDIITEIVTDFRSDFDIVDIFRQKRNGAVFKFNQEKKYQWRKQQNSIEMNRNKSTGFHKQTCPGYKSAEQSEYDADGTVFLIEKSTATHLEKIVIYNPADNGKQKNQNSRGNKILWENLPELVIIDMKNNGSE